MKKLALCSALTLLLLLSACSDEATLVAPELDTPLGSSQISGANASGGGLTGAIFTTDAVCSGVDLNIYASKDAVYLDGGPHRPGAAGLPDGTYYVQVTEPGGTVLGKSLAPVATVLNGQFVLCYQLSAIVLSASSGFTVPGYDDTGNPGGEYKVWVSTSSTFPNNASKTDNFKVKDGEVGPLSEATLHVIKFYDANANGTNDAEDLITGWKVRIKDGIDLIRYTTVDIVLAPDDYIVSEFAPVETNWFPTTPNPVDITLPEDGDETVAFGNVCVGAGGGKTLGFWSNKNGGNILKANSNAILNQVLALNLRKADGNLLGVVSLATFQSFLTGANAANMANMLSAQLAAMKANVLSGGVSGAALIYAPGTTSANALGFATVNDIIDEANAELGLHGSTPAGSPFRAYQEALKNALDKANNNLTFVQSSPCPFSFPEDV